jgi:transcription-repair coupling factor (superfamily II helicase)
MKELLEFLKGSKAFTDVSSVVGEGQKCSISGGEQSFYSYLLAGLFKKLHITFLAVLPEEQAAEIFFQDIAAFAGEESVRFLPAPELFAGEAEVFSAVMFERVLTLSEIARAEKPFILVSQPAALLIKDVPPIQEFAKSSVDVSTDLNFRRDAFIEHLLDYGYEESGIVEQPGEFARRGGIVDFFPLNSEFPLRVEFMGNRINSVRKFQPAGQRSFEKIKGFTLFPLNEKFVGETADRDVIDELEPARTFFVEPGRFYDSPLFTELKSRHLLDEERLKDCLEGASILQKNITTFLPHLESSPPGVEGRVRGLSRESRKHFHFKVFPASERFKVEKEVVWNPFPGERIAIFSDNPAQENRLKEILNQQKVATAGLLFHRGMLSSGFSFPESNLTVLSNDELFSRYRMRRPSLTRYAESVPLGSYSEIKEGDYVVHYNEGIGRFKGMERVNAGGKEEEFAVLEYEGGDKMYVPLSQISLVHKYVGEGIPVLSPLGGKNWIRVRDRVKNAIRDMAADLYQLYLERKKEKGISFMQDDEFQREFEESFIYRETEDQMKVVEEVKKDMMSCNIMDRLVCGDSGYGKTEVALRAACKAVFSGMQAVMLVPTTVLALQHFLTFRERFADFPVRVENLSRLVPGTKQAEILKGIKDGNVDIVIGTHRLLQDDVRFHNPGLLIVDEEQRFGVAHKEKLKKRFSRIDVLTLTATPIPRTLYMTISGLRDISVIETPPQGRLSVATYAGRYDEKLIKEAVLRELERKGQVFYLHNFIYDIDRVKTRLQEILPFARIEAAHGRMAPEKIATIMGRFSKGEIDVLVATTIVENGIDIPRANTLIVDNAHRFGLADLYQLRGRIGRYKWRAYAYFLVPDHVYLTETAKERLVSLQELNKPGSGYSIALKDLEIRGAGNVLGRQQHGFIEQVGFNLYCQFWKDVVGELRGSKTEAVVPAPPRVKIPRDYIQNPSLRLYVYKRIAAVKTKKDAENLLEELEDRFGPPPQPLSSILKKGAVADIL